jgi:hypothetical protein
MIPFTEFLFSILLEWVSECSLFITTSEQLFSYIMERTYVTFAWDDWWCPFCTITFSGIFYSDCWLKYICCSTPTHYSDSSKLVFVITPERCLLVEKQHIPILYSHIWLDPTGVRTHDVPHSKRPHLTITLPMWSSLYSVTIWMKYTHKYITIFVNFVS